MRYTQARRILHSHRINLSVCSKIYACMLFCPFLSWTTFSQATHRSIANGCELSRVCDVIPFLLCSQSVQTRDLLKVVDAGCQRNSIASAR